MSLYNFAHSETIELFNYFNYAIFPYVKLDSPVEYQGVPIENPGWYQTLKPLAYILAIKYEEYLPKLNYPIRTGQHDNTAFGLSLSIDYARCIGDKGFEQLIIEHAKRLYKNDVNCNLSYEPSGNDFLSPCFEEALLMSKILDTQEYKVWLKTFLPEIFQPDFSLEP